MTKNIFSLCCIIILISTSLFSQQWETDLDKAKTLAADQSRNIILVFQGSDWCMPCIKLDKEVWSTDTFQSYAKDHFVLLKADFPRKKKNRLSKELQQQSNDLAEIYNADGLLPKVLVLDYSGQIIGQTGYEQMEAEAYIRLLTSFEQ